MSAALRQLPVTTPSADRKMRNGVARTLPALTPSERKCPPPPPAGFRPCGEGRDGPFDAGNVTQRPPGIALPPPQPQQRLHQPSAAAAGRGQLATAAVPGSAAPRSEQQKQQSLRGTASASSPEVPAKKPAIAAAGAGKESLDGGGGSSGSGGGSSWQPLPLRPTPADATRSATTAATGTVGGCGSGGRLFAPPPPLQRLFGCSPSATDDGLSVLTPSSTPFAAADATTEEDDEDPWREATQADAEVAAAVAAAAAAAAPAAAAAATPVALALQPGHLVVSRLGRLGIRNFDSRDSISTDDCPTDASSMRRSLYSVDTVRCGTPYEGHLSVNADTPASDAPLCSPATADSDDDDGVGGDGGPEFVRLSNKSSATAAAAAAAEPTAAERQWLWRARWRSGGEEATLVNGKRARDEAPLAKSAAGAADATAAKRRQRTSSGAESTEYRVGSCWHCLINVPCPSLLTWLSLCLATLGWSVSGYMSASLVKKLLDHVEVNYSWFSSPAIDEICIIVLGVMTVCIGVLFLVVATFSSENMSRYFFNTRSKNRMGRCINILILVLCYIAVIVWSGICAGTMIPITALGIIHRSERCIQLDALGFSMSTPMTTCDIEAFSDQVKEALVTLAICLAFAFVVQLSMVAFLVNVSANIRHLKESRYETYNAGTGCLAQSNPVVCSGGEQRDSAM